MSNRALVLFIVTLFSAMVYAVNTLPLFGGNEKLHRVVLHYPGRSERLNLTFSQREELVRKIKLKDFTGSLWIGDRVINMRTIECIKFWD